MDAGNLLVELEADDIGKDGELELLEESSNWGLSKKMEIISEKENGEIKSLTMKPKRSNTMKDDGSRLKKPTKRPSFGFGISRAS